MRPSKRSAVLVLLAAVLAVVAPACGADDPAPPVALRGDGPRVEVSLAPFQIRVLDPHGKELLRTLTGGGADPYGAPAATRDDGPDATKIIPGWDGYFPAERAWSHGTNARVVAKTESTAAFELDASPGTIAIDVAIEGAKVRIKMTATATGDAWNKSTMSFRLAEDTHFFGLGERWASVDHRGLSLYSWAEEGGTGGGENAPAGDQNPFPNGPSMTYFPVPFFHSSDGLAVHLDTTYRTETHFGSERPDAGRDAARTTSFETVLYVSDDPLASLDAFTRDTGRPVQPSWWTFGPRRRLGGGDMIDGVPEYVKLRQAHVPVTTIDDATHFLPSDTEIGREDELRQWTSAAHAWGYKVVAYNNPYVSMTRPAAAGDLAEGTSAGLFARGADGAVAPTSFISGGGTPQDVATIDLTNPSAVAWFQTLLRRTLAVGYDGWMHDFGEYVRRPWTFADGRKGDEVHNAFPVLSAKAAYELASKERPGDFFFFVRSGYTGTQQWTPGVWSGDPEATFDNTQGLPAMVRGGMNLGMVGVPYWGSDGSGYKCLTDFPRDKDIYLRWTEFTAVSPIMEEENHCGTPLGPKEKWKLWNDDETIRVYSDMARLHTRLLPYFQALALEASRTGAPIMRHPFLYHPHDPEAWKVESAYYLGPSLWAAPVVERARATKDTWLPPGKWVDFTDHTVYEGGAHVTLPAPLDTLPLLVKDGGIVPLLDASIETLAPTTQPGIVTLEQVRDRLDVIAVLSSGREAEILLADGTVLKARRGATTAPPSALAEVAPDALADCAGGCFASTSEAGVDRLRITTPLETDATFTHDDVTIQAHGPTARRVRWDVLRVR